MRLSSCFGDFREWRKVAASCVFGPTESIPYFLFLPFPQGGAVSDLRAGLERRSLFQLLSGLLNTNQLGRHEGAAKLVAIRAATAWSTLVAEDYR